MKQTNPDMKKGHTHKTNSYGEVEIVEYLGANEVMVRFIGYSHIVKSKANAIRNGKVKNVMMPNVQGVGYTGVGIHSATKDKKAYDTWQSMIRRCYSVSGHKKQPSYIGCSVTQDWLNFQNFAKWFYENYESGLHLDKDILEQGNKTYSPEKCLFIPQALNNLLVERGAKRGEYKLGVSFSKAAQKFQVKSGKTGVNYNYEGLFVDEDEAHGAYCKYKYNLIKQAASEQPDRVRGALLNWRIPEY